MTYFSSEELNLITLYDPGSRNGTIAELRDMTRYLMPDERDLQRLAKNVMAKLEAMTDEEYDDLTEALVPDYADVFSDEDSAWGTSLHLWLDDINPDDEIE